MVKKNYTGLNIKGTEPLPQFSGILFNDTYGLLFSFLWPKSFSQKELRVYITVFRHPAMAQRLPIVTNLGIPLESGAKKFKKRPIIRLIFLANGCRISCEEEMGESALIRVLLATNTIM
jgi:hypothetical protein